MNTNRATGGNLGLTSCATIIKDHHGNWIIGCSKGFGVNSNFVAKLNGLRDGFLLVQNRGLFLVKVELNSLFVLKSLQTTNSTYPLYIYSLIENCK